MKTAGKARKSALENLAKARAQKGKDSKSPSSDGKHHTTLFEA